MRLMCSRAAAEYATGGVASSRFAAPSRRSGPGGDPPPPVAERASMAVSQLPARTDTGNHKDPNHTIPGHRLAGTVILILRG